MSNMSWTAFVIITGTIVIIFDVILLGLIKRIENLEHLVHTLSEAIKAPSTDVQPVVRCKDCIHYMPYDWMFSEVWQSQNIEDYPQNEIGCEWVDHYVRPNDYCSFGEHKSGEQNETD